jgi:hypothetical protein
MKHATLIHVASSKLFVRMLALELLAVQLGKPSEHWEICHPSTACGHQKSSVQFNGHVRAQAAVVP